MTQTFPHRASTTLAATLMALAGFSVSATAAEPSDTSFDAATPISSSQSALLRNAPRQAEPMRSSDPINEDVPATRSQIEVLDHAHAHVATTAATASIR